jgi:hypothetical protein
MIIGSGMLSARVVVRGQNPKLPRNRNDGRDQSSDRPSGKVASAIRGGGAITGHPVRADVRKANLRGRKVRTIRTFRSFTDS